MDELYDLLRQCTVRILRPGGHATGFFVAPGVILTCAHVVEKVQSGTRTTQVQVYWREQNYPAQVDQYLIKPEDLALLRVQFTDHPCVLLDTEIAFADPLMSYGYPDDYPEGDTSTYEWEGWSFDSQRLLKFKKGEVNPGMSGSPLLNCRTGKVCGVVKRTRERRGDLGGRAIPTETVLQVFQKLVDEQKVFHQQHRRWFDCLKARGQKPAYTLWYVPYQRNSIFTGRENILTKLRTALKVDKTTALSQPQAISGLGGIGKTQTALEYAYRYKLDYDAIMWIRAESRETLILDFVTIADLLDLPEKRESEQRLTIEALKRWFQNHTEWLLIFDNVDDLSMVQQFLPSGGRGHILLTTHAQAIGRIGQCIEIKEMSPKEGALFLLHRAAILDHNAPLESASIADRDTAEAISSALGGLPLALDQAGAYIEETQCSLSEYLQLYQTRQGDLLQRRGKLAIDHPDSVVTTLSLSFEYVQHTNPAAAELLRLCAFLDPDKIQEEIITKGASELGSVIRPIAIDEMKWNEAIAALLAYSLVRRNPDHTLTIHRLVQAVLRQSMNKKTARRRAERAVRAVNSTFPEVKYENWLHCQQFIPHVLTCAGHIKQWDMAFPEAARLLNNAGDYLSERAQYEQAESLYQRALAIRKKVLETEHPETAESLNNLAALYFYQGKYEQAESLYQRALAIRERVLGPEDPKTAESLNNLAALYCSQGKYEQSESSVRRALAICEKVLGPDHPDTATSLDNLAALYRRQGKDEQAESRMQRALTIREKVLRPDHPDTLTSFNNLAELYESQGKHEQAKPLFQRVLAIQERKQNAGITNEPSEH